MQRVDPLNRRSDDARATCDTYGPDNPPPGIWLGTSVEDQPRANERIPHLLAAPAVIRFLSCEPLLGQVLLSEAWHGESALASDCWGDCNWCRSGADFPPLHNCQAGRNTEAEWKKGRSGVDWVIAGGESGLGARPMHPDWVRLIRDECADAGVPFFFKQHGAFLDFEHLGERWNSMTNAQRVNQQFVDGKAMICVGKKAAGRLLDGVEHNGMPA